MIDIDGNDIDGNDIDKSRNPPSETGKPRHPKRDASFAT
tara:strand:- start:5351 stop:5467 length:117 start_codon:yes stop_codon:yes gene_type:complete